jgi:uncharacterized LabA/DUF88 family protein
MRTAVYVDGCNLYYRMLKHQPGLKWLNIKALVEAMLLPDHTITAVNYYTARLTARPDDPHAPARQLTYMNALKSLPEVSIHCGTFKTTKVWMHLAEPVEARPRTYRWTVPEPHSVRVIKTEEKGSDVSLGCHLVRDAIRGNFDVAVVITSDSDLVEPIRIATQDIGRRVGLLVPAGSKCTSLKATATFYRHIEARHLRAAQFSDEVSSRDGARVTRPTPWRAAHP